MSEIQGKVAAAAKVGDQVIQVRELKQHVLYRKYIKRLLDLTISLLALIILSPFLLIFAFIGAFAMQGNPFFVQERSGMNDKIFKLIKYRTMSNSYDKNGDLLPDSQRLNKYGRFLRVTSIDELPELINILKGDMSIVGPRPLVVQYLPYYNEEERRRHAIRPGLTGLAQINGRNIANWPDRFRYDIEYVNTISFRLDAAIVFRTVIKVIKHGEVIVRGTGQIIDFDKYRILENSEGSANESTATSANR